MAAETQAIAALLHDAVEDQGGPRTLAAIRQDSARRRDVVRVQRHRRGAEAAVGGAQGEYVEHLGDASEDTILVSLADKLDNARAILRDYRDRR